MHETAPSSREACVSIYTGYGRGYQPGNLHDIVVRDVSSLGAQYAVMVKADVQGRTPNRRASPLVTDMQSVGTFQSTDIAQMVTLVNSLTDDQASLLASTT